MITSKRELALKLSNNEKVSTFDIGKRLMRIVDMWLKRKEIVIENNIVYLTK